mgnify:CR=1 FL=1
MSALVPVDLFVSPPLALELQLLATLLVVSFAAPLPITSSSARCPPVHVLSPCLLLALYRPFAFDSPSALGQLWPPNAVGSAIRLWQSAGYSTALGGTTLHLSAMVFLTAAFPSGLMSAIPRSSPPQGTGQLTACWGAAPPPVLCMSRSLGDLRGG